jgi:hypothetical protein
MSKKTYGLITQNIFSTKNKLKNRWNYLIQSILKIILRAQTYLY